MFRTKVTAKSISHSNCFRLLLQKKAYNSETKAFKRNLWYGLLDRISNFRYAKYYLILSRIVAAEAFQVLLNLKFSKTRNKPVLLKPHLSWISFKKKRQPGYFHFAAYSESSFGQAPPKKI